MKLGAGNVILETHLDAGRKMESFRSNVHIVNSTASSFEVAVKRIVPDRHDIFEVEADPQGDRFFVTVFENQIFHVGEGWRQSRKDRRKYSTLFGNTLSDTSFPNLPLPLGWEWCDEWQLRRVSNVDKSGWCYFDSFDSFHYPPKSKGSRNRGLTDLVRSRCFIRYCKQATLSDEEIAVVSSDSGTVIGIGSVKPGESIAVSKNLCVVGGLLELLMRPMPHPSSNAAGTGSYEWSVLVSSGSEKKLSLGSMEEMTQLMACAPCNKDMTGDDLLFDPKPSLFFVHCEGVELSDHSLELMTDWKMTISPPITIENDTDVQANISVWEHPKVSGGSAILPECKCKSTVDAHHSVQDLKIDPRRTITMTFIPEGWSWPKGYGAIPVCQDSQRSQKIFPIVKDDLVLYLNVSCSKVYPNVNFPLVVKVWAKYCIRNESLLPLSFCVVPEKPQEQDEGAGAQKLDNTQYSAAMRVLKTPSNKGLDTILAPNVQKQIVSPCQVSLFSATKSYERDGLKLAISDSAWLSESILLVPGGDIVLVKGQSTYTGLVYNVVVSVQMHATSRTYVVVCKPHVRLTNFTGVDLSFCPGDVVEETNISVLRAGSSNVEVHWTDAGRKSLQLKLDGYLWSKPFTVEYPGGSNMKIVVESQDLLSARVIEVQTKLDSPGCLHVVFSSVTSVSFASPYNIVNFSSETIHFRQAYLNPPPEFTQIKPYSSAVFYWTSCDAPSVFVEIQAKDSPSRVYCLYEQEVAKVEFDSEESEDGFLDIQGKASSSTNELKPLPINQFPGECSITISKNAHGLKKLVISPIFESPEKDAVAQQRPRTSLPSPSHLELNVTLLADFIDVSIVDFVPQELALLTIKSLACSMSSGIGTQGEASVLKLAVQSIELNDMLSVTQFPVIFRCVGDEMSGRPFVAAEIHQVRRSEDEDLQCISFGSFALGKAVQIQIQEKFVWVFVKFLKKLSFGKLETSSDTFVDPDMQIGLLSVSGIKAHISFLISPDSRPDDLDNMSKFGLSFANIDDMSVSIIKKWELRNVTLKRSMFFELLQGKIRHEIAMQILPMLFTGMSVSSVATGALSSVAGAAAILSFDSQFGKSREKSARVDNFTDGLVVGGESLAKGIASGVSGFFTKPFEGARQGGAKGFMKGVAKGVIGVAAKPLSGALDMVSKGVEGASASIDNAKNILDVPLSRRRYPLAFRGDSILRPYDPYSAQGQHLLKTSVSRSFGSTPISKEKNAFDADRYEYHEILPQNKVLVVTNQRIVLLKIVKSSGENSVVLWDAVFPNILSVELPASSSSSSRSHAITVILSANTQRKLSLSQNKFQQSIQCRPDAKQVTRLYDAIHRIRTREMEKIHKSDHFELVESCSESSLTDLDMVPMMECQDFSLVWSSDDYKSEMPPISIWRPRCPQGYCSVGDIVSFGLQPPSEPAMLLRDTTAQKGGSADPVAVSDSWVAAPVSFHLSWRDTKKSKSSPVSFWTPVPPEGYVSLGCVVLRGNEAPNASTVLCVKDDMVYEASAFDSPCWYVVSRDKQRWPLSLWQVDNAFGTFIAFRGHSKPSHIPVYDLMI